MIFSVFFGTSSQTLLLQRAKDTYQLGWLNIFEIFQYDKSGSHKCISQIQVQYGDIKNCPASEHLEYADPASNLVLYIDKIYWVTFLDYIFGGCEVGFQIAIDCTGSNQMADLHTSDESRHQDVQSIRDIGGILEHYASN